MSSKTGLYSKVATWAGWLLGGVLLLALAVAAMTLSTDGARLKRLFAGRPGSAGEPAQLVAASYEPSGGLPAGPPRAERAPLRPPVEAPEASVSLAAFSLSEAMVPGGAVITPPAVVPGWAVVSSAALVSAAGSSNDPGGRIFAEVIGRAGMVEVLLDGRRSGIAPVLIGPVGPGPHKLTFQSGAVSWDEEVWVSAGDTTMVACVAPDELLSATGVDSIGRATPLLP